MEKIFNHCDICQRPIMVDEPYASIVHNIETYSEHPPEITVHDSLSLHTLCLRCNRDYEREKTKADIMNKLTNNHHHIDPLNNPKQSFELN